MVLLLLLPRLRPRHTPWHLDPYQLHGSADEADERTPISQAESLEKALKANKNPYETLYIDNEYHCFIKEGNRLKAMETIVEFLNEHIGS